MIIRAHITTPFMAHTCAPSTAEAEGRQRERGSYSRTSNRRQWQVKGEAERETASARRCSVWSNDSVMAVSTSCVSGGSSSSGNGSTSTQMPHVCNKRNFRKRQNGVPKIAPLMMSGKRSGSGSREWTGIDSGDGNRHARHVSWHKFTFGCCY